MSRLLKHTLRLGDERPSEEVRLRLIKYVGAGIPSFVNEREQIYLPMLSQLLARYSR